MLRRRGGALRRRLRRAGSPGAGPPRPYGDRPRARRRHSRRGARRGRGPGPASGGARPAGLARERCRRLGRDARHRPKQAARSGKEAGPRADRGSSLRSRELRPRRRDRGPRVRRRPPGGARGDCAHGPPGRSRDRQPAELVELLCPVPAARSLSGCEAPAGARTKCPAAAAAHPGGGLRAPAHRGWPSPDGRSPNELPATGSQAARVPVAGRADRVRVRAESGVKRILTVVLVAAAAAAPATSRLAAGRGTITTVAGTGAGGLAGEGGPATQAAVDHPRGLAVLRDGSILVAEPYANVVRRIAPGGTVSTVAGDGRAGLGGDGGPAAAAELDFVHGVAAMPDGGFVLADTLNERIRRVFPDGTITTVAGIGINGYNGDGRPATTAALADPRGVATFPDGRILIPDTGNNRIRLVALDGTIRTVAGVGTRGFSGDGGPAIDAELSSPFGVAPLPDGGFLIEDSGNGRIRRVSPDGHITTVAGDGIAGYAGDGGPAVDAELRDVHNVAASPGGGFVIADTGNDRVRLVRSGTITTVAGSGAEGFSGDGGPATAAELDHPKAVAVTADGSLLIGDAVNN